MPAGALRERITALAPRGELFGSTLRFADAGDKRLPDITGRLRFADVGFDPFGKAAGITGFDGAIEGRGGGGILSSRRAMRRSTGRSSGARRSPILRGDGRVEWQRFGDGVRIWLDDAFVDSGHGLARGKARLLLRPGERAAHGHERDGVGFRRDAALALPADRPAVAEDDPLA